METLSQPLGLGQLSNFADLDLSTVSTDYPILESGIYPWNIGKASYEISKDKKSEMMVLELHTVAPAKDKHGKEVPAGYKLTHRIGLTPSYKLDANGQPIVDQPVRTPEMIMRDVASMLDGVFGEAARKTINLQAFDINSLVNQQIMGRTSISPEKDGYPEQTRLSRFVKKEGNTPSLPTSSPTLPTGPTA